MDVRKIAFLLLVLVLSAALISGYTASTGSKGTTTPPVDVACTDSKDNDHDGLKNGNDPGCTKPYDEDNSEAAVYDLDASWVFSGESAPTSSGPSVFYGWKVVDTGASTDFVDENSGGDIDEAYVRNPVKNWGGGTKRHANDTGSGTDWTTSSVNSPYSELVDTPHLEMCGDTVKDPGENNFNCPEDYGMADDWGTTKSDSSHGDTETVSDNMGPINGQDVLYIKDYDMFSGNNILYEEYGYDESSDTINIQTEDGGKHHTKDPWNTDCQSSPDFFVESSDNDILKKVWCEPGDGSTQTQTVKDVYETLQDADTPKDETYNDYDTSHSTKVCTSGGANSSCGSYEKKCWAGHRTGKTAYEKQTTAVKEKTTIDSQAYYTVPSDPEYDNRSDSDSFTLYYWRDVEAGEHSIDYKGCSKTKKKTGCDTPAGKTPTCSDTSKTYYTSTQKNYAQDYEYNTVTVQMERITTPWPEQQVFNTNDAETGRDAIHILFDTDYSRSINHNAQGGEGYYQVEKTRDNKDLGNDIAVSSSRFTLDIDMGTHEFKSKRDYFETWDADGPNGNGDGFISILYPRGYISGSKRTTGWTNEFLQNEVSTGNTDASFVTNPQDNAGDSHYQFTIPSCPAPFITCLSAVDVSLKNLDKWGNPFDPSTGLHWQFNTKDTNRSLGTCEMYQALDPQNQLQSNYDSDVSGTTAAGERCVGDTADSDPKDPGGGGGGGGNNNPEFWVHMEGPEVNENAVSSYPGHYETSADQVSDCNLRGKNVNEGRVADVATDYYSNYEEGGHSPDWEVCLDIDQQTVGGPGDDVSNDNYDYDRDGNVEEVGGEWWDLDNERINQYLRSGGPGHGLITGGDTSNASDIAYYWRDNVNPYHSVYNPQGGKSGVPLEDDCGRDDIPDNLLGCTEEEAVSTEPQSKNPVVYTFFSRPTP